MKRMVENSEKIEELADAVEVNNYNVKFNGGLTTSNITTPGGDNIPIFSDEEVDFDGNFPGTVVLTNLGTALILEAFIDQSVENGKYPIARILRSDESISYVKITNGDEFNPSFESGAGPDEFVVATEFNKTLADHAKPEYRLVLLIGHYSKEK